MKEKVLEKYKIMTTRDWIFIIIYFVILAVATVPVFFYPTNVAEPFIFGIPFATMWQIILAYVWVACFVIQYSLEKKTDDLDFDVDPAFDYLAHADILDE